MRNDVTLKKIISLSLLLLCFFSLVGCKDNKVSDSDNNSADIVFTIDNVYISLEEAKYYAYNKQANYEAYYLASGNDIDWYSSYIDGNDASLEALVKSEALEQLKKVVLLSEYAKDKGIQLSDADKQDIKNMVNTFLSDSNDTLLKKIDADKDILNIIFTRQKYYNLICDKIYEDSNISVSNEELEKATADIMQDASLGLTQNEALEYAYNILIEEKQNSAINELYEKLSKDDSLKVNKELWNGINFKESIFTSEDINQI